MLLHLVMTFICKALIMYMEARIISHVKMLFVMDNMFIKQ